MTFVDVTNEKGCCLQLTFHIDAVASFVLKIQTILLDSSLYLVIYNTFFTLTHIPAFVNF